MGESSRLRGSTSCNTTRPISTTQLVEMVNRYGETIKSLTVQNTTLDDVFVHYTGRALRDEQVKALGFVMPPRPGMQP
jgi:ABC-2 type transport system ATP-binding protein